MAQLFRDMQLKNVFIMEEIDDNEDKLIDYKQKIDFLKRELLTLRKRQLSSLTPLYDLSKSFDRELDFLALSLHQHTSERDLLTQRRDEAFSQLVDLLSERRRILSQVEDRTRSMGERYVASRSEQTQQKLQSHEMIEQQVRVWSSKIPLEGVSQGNAAERQETQFKLQQMLKELELKQKQLVKLL